MARTVLLLTLVLACRPMCDAAAQTKAFPQAEGYGQEATGGRGGDVYHVTKLTDDGSVGTLRHGLESAPSAGRTIVFDVGGWITLGSKLGATRGRITIAGQTAPGGGIGVKGDQFSVGASDVVIRHMRFRPGKSAGRVDSLSISSGHDVIFDHVSASFSYDENASANALTRGGVSNLTMQYSTISYGLEDHSAGSLIQDASNLTYHHNLYAHNNTRNPKARVEGDGIVWTNNVVYDYNNGFIAGDSDTTGYFWKASFDGNYYITGPGDTGRPMISNGRSWNYGLYYGTNAYDNDGDAVHDGVLYTGNGVNGAGLESVVSGTYTWAATPYSSQGVWQDISPQAAYERVLAQFGATPWNRDEVDRRLYGDVANRTGGLITRESDLVGISNGGFGTLAAGVAPQDTDRDGIPDAWETRHGTNPFVANNNGDFDQDGYTDLEEYLNELAAFAAVGPLEFTGVGRYADSKRWTNRWEPSRLDDVRVTHGAAFVDAVGQNAGTLSVGAGPGGDGRLYVTSGWIEVSNGLAVGGAGGLGRVEQHGGEVRVLSGALEVAAGEYKLLGGRLTADSVEKSPQADFRFAGGTLATASVGFDLVNEGGALDVHGAGVGLLAVSGGYSAASGSSLVVDVASPSSADLLVVLGEVSLGGALSVRTPAGFQPAAGQSWLVVAAGSLRGQFASVTPGFHTLVDGARVWLVADGPSAVPEPAALLLAAIALAVAGRRRLGSAPVAAALVACVFVAGSEGASVAVVADAQLSENGTTGLGDATDAGTGSGVSLNARWNYSSSPANRNEWIALKFDLGAYSPSRIQNVRLETTMARESTNNSWNLALYALTPGVAGEDWSEATVTYGSMPGFSFDGLSTTNVLDVGGALRSLGSFAVSGAEGEGAVATIDPASLTSMVRSMGDHRLLTLLVGYAASSNGQWRITSREATSTTTGVVTGQPGDLAARLVFDVTYGGVLGDYNDDGAVNAADYTVWRDAPARTSLPNEEVSPGVADVADYLFWTERYGASDTGQPFAVAAPEPCGLAAVAAACPAVVGRRARRTPAAL